MGGSLAACFPPCNRLSREAFGLPIWAAPQRNSTGTALAPRSFLLTIKAGIRPARFTPLRRTTMAYERYPARDAPRDERSRWRDENRERGGSEERGFFERAGDEVASWFGDEEAERRRREDERMRQHERGYGRDWRGEERGRFYGTGRERERSAREREEEFRSPRWTGRDTDHEPARGQWQPNRERGYRPVTGDYSRGSDQF